MLYQARVHAVKEASPGECGEVEDLEDGSISGCQESSNREMMFVSQLSFLMEETLHPRKPLAKPTLVHAFVNI
jgi:hypothetical protein